MKRTFLLSLIACGASLALCTGLRAQDAAPAPATTGTDGGPGGDHHWKHGGPGGGDMLEHLTKALDLTADQQAKIKPILEAGHKQMKAIHEDTSISDLDKRPKMKEVRDGMDGQINGILTPDQQKKFAELKEHRRGPGGPGGPGHHGDHDNDAPASAPATSGS